eukprot:15873-Heterococcus_DN1.PRE.3
MKSAALFVSLVWSAAFASGAHLRGVRRAQGVVAPGALGRAANTALPGGAGGAPAAGAVGDDFGDNWFNESEPVGTGAGNAAIGTGMNAQQPATAGMNTGGQPGVAGPAGAANDGFAGDWFADDNDGLNDQALFGNVLGNTGPTTPTTPGGGGANLSGAAGGVNRGANLSGAVGTGGTGVGTAAAPIGTGMVAQDQSDPTGFAGMMGDGTDVGSPEVNVDVDPTTGKPKITGKAIDITPLCCMLKQNSAVNDARCPVAGVE